MGINLSEAYKDNPVEKQHITPIDFNSIKQIPESHSWTHDLVQSNNNNNNNNNNNDNKFVEPSSNNESELTNSMIPTIELEDPNVISQIYQACNKWGLFRITRHGIPTQLFENIELQAKKLFGLPLEEKMKVLRAPQGATGYGSPRIAPFFSKLMWSEGFTIMGNSAMHHAKLLWPNDYQEFCDVVDEYQAQMKALSEKLMGLILKSLNIPDSFMTWAGSDPTRGLENICTALQLNSYPACPDPTRAIGLAQHTDTFLFTILHQSGNANGLQVFKEGPGWVTVDPDPNTLVVNVGDLLHIASNGRFHSVVHRAVVNHEKQRVSMAYFYGPPLDFVVSPFLGYPGNVGPAQFKPMEVKEYVGIKAKYLDLALSYARI